MFARMSFQPMFLVRYSKMKTGRMVSVTERADSCARSAGRHVRRGGTGLDDLQDVCVLQAYYVLAVDLDLRTIGSARSVLQRRKPAGG